MMAQTGYVNVAVANIYRDPTFHCEVDTQAFIRTEDNYTGWANKHQVIETGMRPQADWVLLTEPYLYFYEKPDVRSKKVRDGLAGISCPVISGTGHWRETLMPDGAKAWFEEKHIGTYRSLNRHELVAYAYSFMGISYTWGGKTPFGFDCSGFIQFVYKMFGRNIRRDAQMQYEDSKHVSNYPHDGNPGDLMFFSENQKKITHVGFCIEPGKLLHCRGMVKLNSLMKNNPIFDKDLLDCFAEIRTFF
ncbi:MAG: NlpC/P60 family protein [Calditrichaceae bacterium]